MSDGGFRQDEQAYQREIARLLAEDSGGPDAEAARAEMNALKVDGWRGKAGKAITKKIQRESESRNNEAKRAARSAMTDPTVPLASGRPEEPNPPPAKKLSPSGDDDPHAEETDEPSEEGQVSAAKARAAMIQRKKDAYKATPSRRERERMIGNPMSKPISDRRR